MRFFLRPTYSVQFNYGTPGARLQNIITEIKDNFTTNNIIYNKNC